MGTGHYQQRFCAENIGSPKSDVMCEGEEQFRVKNPRTMMPTMPSWAAALVELMGHYEECCAKMCINIVVESRSILHVSWAALWLRSDGDYYYLYHCPLSTLCHLAISHTIYMTRTAEIQQLLAIFYECRMFLSCSRHDNTVHVTCFKKLYNVEHYVPLCWGLIG